ASLAARLVNADRLDLIAVADLAGASQAGWLAARAADHERSGLEAALEEARRNVGIGQARLLRGRPLPALLASLDDDADALLALGAPGRGRLRGLASGAVGSALLRRAPCSVLFARPGSAGDVVPKRIVVGVDGSNEALNAHAVAVDLADRFDAELRTVAGLGGNRADAERLADLHPDAHLDARPPVDCLLAASAAAELLVVGSRSLRGLAALTSVSERVAHHADCSVLVLRAGPSRDVTTSADDSTRQAAS
ncbi:MAG: universal stress protein, partial [Gaiellaceae bacterium]